MTRTEQVFKALNDDFGFEGAQGSIKFNLKDYEITVEQNNVVGNILEEWLDKWMTSKGIVHIHNEKQASPDFWLNPDDLESDWLEVKSFTGSPNFDVHSKHLLIKYKSEGGVVTIEKFWMKNLWEICSTSSVWPVKVQYKNKVIVNIRPSTWYSDNADYPSFESLEDFLAALEETIYQYHDTRSTVAEQWSKKLCKSYKKHYGKELKLPRWNDIKSKYIKEKEEEESDN